MKMSKTYTVYTNIFIPWISKYVIFNEKTNFVFFFNRTWWMLTMNSCSNCSLLYKLWQVCRNLVCCSCCQGQQDVGTVVQFAETSARPECRETGIGIVPTPWCNHRNVTENGHRKLQRKVSYANQKKSFWKKSSIDEH